MRSFGTFFEWKLSPDLFVLCLRCTGEIRTGHRSRLEVVTIWESDKCTAVGTLKGVVGVEFVCEGYAYWMSD
jgi:hypothetical protein